MNQACTEVYCATGSYYSNAGCDRQCLCGTTGWVNIRRMEIWTYSQPPSPPSPPPAAPWSFSLSNARIASLGIDAAQFNVKCYDKLTDGSSTGTWHERCKYHGPHVMLLELANNKVLGAYLGAPLSDTPTIDDFGNQVGHTENNAWLSSSSAFLFSLPPEGVYGDAIKLPVGNPAKAFYESPNNGARFASLRCAAMHGCAVCVCERV